MNTIEELKTTVKRNPSPQYMLWERQYCRRELEYEIRTLERKFKSCIKEEQPGPWKSMQKRLGELYKELMGTIKNET